MMRLNQHICSAMIFILLLACFSGTVVQAQDDGGGRSVLADGAGNRALGLGGAYVAVADDASAAVWNPAGLGFVQRRELQVTKRLKTTR